VSRVGEKRARFAACATLSLIALVSGCGAPSAPGPGQSQERGQNQGPVPPATQRFGAIDAERVAHAAEQAGEWLTGGGDGSGAYFSHLTQINDHNVQQLGFAWDYALHSTRGLEATPIVVDGTMYTSGNWGKVYALDAATGRELWVYDPGVDAQWGRYACCDVVNRGVAVWQGKVYVASLDGYLHALDAATGHLVWKVDTLTGRAATDFHYFVSGAPLIAGDAVVIGNGGADFRGARGSISAYDLSSGKFRWRFFTVPRDPKLGPQDQPHLKRAADTWDGRYDWSTGGGGSVWDGLSYDPELGLIYFGTANPSPYVIGQNNPHGDELYAASMLAVRAQTGELAWHYQEVPGDGWDYDATQKVVLAALDIGGARRAVLLQAAKNGYVYVLDRATGELLSAHPYAFVNWTKGIDPKSHRPIRNPAADYTGNAKLIFPAMTGAHSWQPMSYSAATGLLYIPVIDAAMVYVDTAHRPAGLVEGTFNVVGIMPEDYDPQGLASLFGRLPSMQQLDRDVQHPLRSRGVLRAVEPLTGRVAWEHPGAIWDGGILSTAGNLVLRGDAAGQFSVYAADSGKLLQRIDVGTSMMAAPMTYSVRGEQYVAVMAGYGGGMLFVPYPADSAARKYGNAGRIVAFKLGGGAVPKPAPQADVPFPQPPPREGSKASIASGEVLYNRFCARCHVFGSGLLPDLRRLSAPTHQLFYEIVLNGAYRGKGMARWDDVLSRADAESIHAYLVDQAWAAYTQPPTSDPAPHANFALESPELRSSDPKLAAQFPEKYVLNGFGCSGGNSSPPLQWSGAPAGTLSYVITLFDMDEHTTPSGWWHWVVYDLPANVTELPAGAGALRSAAMPRLALQGRTDLGTRAYHGPCPDKGDAPHRYVFTIYALDVAKLSVPPDSSGAMVVSSLHEHLLGEATMVVRHGR
jgi:quinohemoprotein ethanol dehydrogenase